MVNMPHWSWISLKRPKWKPLHERIVDELINGKQDKEDDNKWE